ncbi:MAG: hypothetical protein H9W81_18140, partial [Enterococcus sp.]|nr:hypothetical protein [Enterococcus sp.]
DDFRILTVRGLGYKAVIVPITPTKESHLAFTRKTGEHTLASDKFWEYVKEVVKRAL